VHPPFSVVIVIHDSHDELEHLIDSIERHLPDRPELIVVDSGSSDGGGGLASERGAQVITLEGNPGFGAANNAAMAHVTSDVTVLLNPDTELLDGGLSELARRASGPGQLLVPRLLNADGSIQDSAHPTPGTAGALLPALLPSVLLPRPLRVRAEPWRSDHELEVGWAIGACMAARTDLLRDLGPFDKRAFLFFEDLDLCVRAREQGISTRLQPDIALRHAGAHATRPAYGGEPFELLARRRREVVGERLGRRALVLDDASQALTFATRAAGRRLLRRDSSAQIGRLRGLAAARRGHRRELA
jgi:N-acetylglucosaminyl-diphospho-decaprenol L-rhamnosyltransferase